jgi:hypothetical protein
LSLDDAASMISAFQQSLEIGHTISLLEIGFESHRPGRCQAVGRALLYASREVWHHPVLTTRQHVAAIKTICNESLTSSVKQVAL